MARMTFCIHHWWHGNSGESDTALFFFFLTSLQIAFSVGGGEGRTPTRLAKAKNRLKDELR